MKPAAFLLLPVLASPAMATALSEGSFTAPAKDAAEALFREAKELRYAQRWFEAAAVYRKLIQAFPASSRVPEARYWLAATLEQDQRWDEATAAYSDFLAKHPDQRLLGKEARLNRVRCWGLRQWDSPAATEGLATALGDDREEVRLAAALQLSKRKDPRAVPILQEGLGLAGNSESCRLALVAMGVTPKTPANAPPRFLVVHIQEKGKKDTLTVRVSCALARAVTSYLSDAQLRQAQAKGIHLDTLMDQALSAPKGSELFSLDDTESKVTVTVE
ncbi:MAG TPA: HEAT repeat domain-containing protein [Holophagaceae bacterium]|nr:HEAT repeat domain-containing protein [Holophagaceae bacterium]